MTAQRFSTGKLFEWNDKLYEVQRLLPDEKLNIENSETGAIQIVSLNELVKALFDGDLRFISEAQARKSGSPRPVDMRLDLSDYPERLVAQARLRLEIIKPLLAVAPYERTPAAIENRIQEVKIQLEADPSRQSLLRGLSRRSIFRWIRDYTQGNEDLRTLISNYTRSGGKGKTRLDEDVKNLVERVIKDHYYRRERVNLDDLLHLVAARIEEENRLRPSGEQLTRPSKGAIIRRIEAMDLRERFIAKKGKRAAKHELDQVSQVDYPHLPLERVEIDHTRIDLIAVDETDNLPLGRPTLTYCLDMATRYPLGYYLGYEPPGYYTVMECLYHAICPKPDMRQKYNTEHNWIAHGVPSTLVIDNGKEFIGRDLEDACNLLGIILVYSPIRTPEFKAGIERHLGTLETSLFHTLPGTTFSNSASRGDYNSVKQALISLPEIEKALNLFILDRYAERYHTGLNGIPARRWEKATQTNFFPRLPPDRDELRILLSRVEYRTIQRYGIEFERLRYNCAELSSLRLHLNGKPAKIKYHPADLSYIHVLDPQNEVYITVPALDQEYTQGLSLWKHRVILNVAHGEKAEVDMAALGRARLKIQEIVDAARQRKRISTRSRIARWDNSGQAPSLGDTKPAYTPGRLSPAAVLPLPLPNQPGEAIEKSKDDDEWGITYNLPKSRSS